MSSTREKPKSVLTSTVVVENPGPAAAIDATMPDPVPAATTFVGALETVGPRFALTGPAFDASGCVFR